jgi:molybdate transport system ATP-binding protein
MDVRLNRDRFELSAKLEVDEPVTGLFGTSGSGKSTLLGIVAGLIRPQQGYIRFDGEPVFDAWTGLCLPPHRRGVGLVFQDSQLFPQYSVQDNLLYGFRLTPRNQRRFRFEDIVDLLELGRLLKAHPRQISGGEKQRVALGRSLLASPRLLLLDEPLASLDGQLKEQILPFLERIRRELAMPMIYVSHSLPEILRLTDQLVLMSGGAITAHGCLRDLIAAEKSDGLGEANLFPVTVQAHDAEGGCTLGTFGRLRLALPLRSRLAIGSTAYVAVHPGEIALARTAIEGISIQNQLSGRVVNTLAQGGAMRALIDVGVPIWAETSVKAWHDLTLAIGDDVHCLIKTRSFRYLTDRLEGEDFADADMRSVFDRAKGGAA